MIGVALLLVIGAVIAWAIAVGAVAWEALHPPRRTTAWALARGTHPDPEPIERPWRLLRHELADGTTLPYWEIDGDDANGAVVVIVHGWGRSRWDSLRRVGAFLPRASRLVLPDLRGHGEADGRTSLGMREPADLVDLLARLDVNAGFSAGATAAARALVLVGHSL
ncbi:MAG: alpha/beta fold hydrolase, partial [Phycisphaerae bacterium]|nr:alpha/beta fold hydrolase [Phycisphaerae bacterium]